MWKNTFAPCSRTLSFKRINQLKRKQIEKHLTLIFRFFYFKIKAGNKKGSISWGNGVNY
jgi:hypothetical protein